MKAVRMLVVAVVFTAAGPGELVSTADAQELRYVTTNEIEFGGGAVLNFFSRLAGVTGKTEDVTYLKGSRMRQDSGESSTIMDFSAGELIILDHQQKTFMKFTLGDLSEVSEEAARAVREAQTEAAATEEEWEDYEASYDFHITFEHTGEQKDVQGAAAERLVMIVEIEALEEDEEATELEEESGRLVMATEMWNSRDVPGYEQMEEFHQVIRESGAFMIDPAAVEGLQEAFASDERLRAAMEQSAEEMAKAEGMTLESTTHFVIVPDGLTFDRDLAFAEVEREGAGQVARRAVGSAVRGRFGLGRGGAQEPAEEEPRQARLMTMKTHVSDISTDPVDDALFVIPDDYAELQFGSEAAQ